MTSESMVKTPRPILYIFSGLPGIGKTTLSQMVAQQIKAVYLRIDTIEQALRDLCSVEVQSDNLRLGISVVADSCNPVELTRQEWEQVALNAGADYLNIEIICSDAREHRQRVETRIATVLGLRLPTWKEVENREYQEWTADRIIIDTANKSETECLNDLLSELSRLQA
jgi:predicted kinase